MTTWPHLLIEEGPPLAGLGPGDAIAFAPDALVSVSSYLWSGARAALSVAFENETWRADDVVRRGPWTLRFVEDGPALATIKRFGPFLAAHATSLERPFGGRVRSQWLLPGGRDALIVEETLERSVCWFAEPRRTGVTLERFVALAQGHLDRDLAGGIVAQMKDRQPLTWLGFDGVARAVDHGRSPVREGALGDIFRSLTGSAPEERAVSPASPLEIAGVVRALAADAWAREQLLVEECGLLRSPG